MTLKEKSTFEFSSMRPCGRTRPGFSLCIPPVLSVESLQCCSADTCCCPGSGRISKHKQSQFVF